MTYVPLKYPPGVCKINTPYTDYLNGGRVTDMNFFRFNAGQPERLGGAVSILSTRADDIIRGINDLRDFSGNIYLLAGNEKTLQQAISTSTSILNNITPLRVPTGGTGNLSNPFNTVSGSPTVTVLHTAHQQQSGDYVTFPGTATAGGIVINGVYTNIAVTGTNGYTFTSLSSASATTTAVGGTVAYNYYRQTLTNPFVTFLNADHRQVTVTHTAFGGTVGDFVTIANSGTVGGIIPNGSYRISAYVDANTYRFIHTTTATGTATGGGSPDFRYGIPSYSGSKDRFWSLPNYGQTCLASPNDGTIYVWNPAIAGRAYPLNNAPTGVKALFVTPERFPFALGNSTNPMQVKWPDQTDNTNWTAGPNSTANSRTLQEGSELRGGVAVRDGVSLVLSDTAAYPFNYTGDSFVYNSSLAGKGCGLVGQLAICAFNGVAFWMSQEDFYLWDGSLRKIPSDDIHDYVFNDLDPDFAYKCVCRPIAAKDEIWFIYPSLEVGTGENTRYAIYHLDQQCWSTGVFDTVSITDMLDRNYFYTPAITKPYPIVCGDPLSNSSFIGFDIPTLEDLSVFDLDQNPYITFSPLDIAQGGMNMDVFGFIPDFQRVGTNTANTVNLLLALQDYTASATAITTHVLRQNGTTVPRVDLRANARLVGYTIELGDPLTSDPLRLGCARLDAQPGGARR